MKKRQANEVLLSLGTLSILGNERAKATVPGQGVSIRVPSSFSAIGSYFSYQPIFSFHQPVRSKKKKQQKPKKKKKKDRSLIEDGICRVRYSVLPATGHKLTICDHGQMYATGSNVAPSCSQPVLRGAVALAIPEDFCNSTADELVQSDSHQYQHIGIGDLGRLNFQEDDPHATATESQSRHMPPNLGPAPIKSPPAP